MDFPYVGLAIQNRRPNNPTPPLRWLRGVSPQRLFRLLRYARVSRQLHRGAPIQRPGPGICYSPPPGFGSAPTLQGATTTSWSRLASQRRGALSPARSALRFRPRHAGRGRQRPCQRGVSGMRAAFAQKYNGRPDHMSSSKPRGRRPPWAYRIRGQSLRVHRLKIAEAHNLRDGGLLQPRSGSQRMPPWLAVVAAPYGGADFLGLSPPTATPTDSDLTRPRATSRPTAAGSVALNTYFAASSD